MLFMFLAACADSASVQDEPKDPADTADTADTAEGADGSDGSGEAPDWAALLSGAWEGTETSATMGTSRGEYAITSADGQRFDVQYAPGGEVAYLKLYFSGVVVDAADPLVGYVTLPEQIYAEGQTGPATLQLTGGGTYTYGEAVYDGRIDLSGPEVVLEGTITAFGSSEALTFRLTP
jgi:hypothetical protein